MEQKSHSTWTWRQRAGRRHFLKGSGVAALGLAGAAIVGCGDDDDDSNGDEGQPGGQPTSAPSALPDHPLFKGLPGGKRGGKFVWAQSDDPVGGDPHSHEEPGTHALVQPIYSGLFFPWETSPGKPEIVGELVEKWEQPNDTELVLHLRRGVKFQDLSPVNGREFTADDVEYNIQRMKDSRPENRLRGMFDAISAIEKPDSHTAKLKLSQPFAPLLSNLAFTWAAMVPREVAEAGTIERKPIGTGPFILDRWERGTIATWKRNPNYWKPGLPFLDELEMQVIPDRAVREAKYLAKELDTGGVNILGSKKETIDQQMGEIKSKVGGGFYEAQAVFSYILKVYFNLAQKPFSDPRVRQAIMYSFNYDMMVNAFYAGRALRTGIVSAGNEAWAARKEDLPVYDIAKSKSLLSAAGMPDGFKTELWVSPEYSGTQLAPIVAGLLKPSIGVEAGIKTMENAQWISEVYRAKGPYPMTTQADWSFDDPDRTLREYFHSKGTAQHQNINDSQLDAMLDKQRQTLNTAERLTMIQDIQKHIMDNAYTIPLLVGGSITNVPPWLTTIDVRGGNFNSYRIRDLISVSGGPRG